MSEYSEQNAISVFSYQGNDVTFQKGNELMVNATEMAKPFGKRPRNWLDLPSTREFMSALCEVRKSDITDLVVTLRGFFSDGRQQGTWLHQDVALEFARWLSPAFAIWTNDRIKELLTQGVATVRDDDEAILHAMNVLQRRVDSYKQQNQILEGKVELQEQEIKALAPKAEYTDKVLQSTNTYTMTQMGKELNFQSVAKFMFALKYKGIIFKQSGTWMLTAKYAGNGYTQLRTFNYTNSQGIEMTNSITVWTEKGRAFLHQLQKGGTL